jgi:hypothetical protein
MSWLESIAPTIATAIGGPLGGLAYEAVSKALGVSQEDAKTMLDTGKMTADQIAQVKIAELDLKGKEESLGLNFEQLATQDRVSARSMQTETKSIVPPLLAGGVTVGFFGILTTLMLGYAKESNELMIMLGSLGTAWAGVIAFYFGSSSGSQAKDKMIYNSTPTVQ